MLNFFKIELKYRWAYVTMGSELVQEGQKKFNNVVKKSLRSHLSLRTEEKHEEKRWQIAIESIFHDTINK